MGRVRFSSTAVWELGNCGYRFRFCSTFVWKFGFCGLSENLIHLWLLRVQLGLILLCVGITARLTSEKNATKGFSTFQCSIRCAYEHIKSLLKCYHTKSIIFKIASKMTAKF